MNKRFCLLLVAIALLAASCGTTTAPPPVPITPTGENRFFVDPRTGFAATTDPSLEKRFDAAWRSFLSGDITDAQRRFADLRTRDPQYLPAAVGEAAVDLKEGNLTAARAIVQRVEDQIPDYTAARVYDAEIAIAEHRTRAAYDIYHSLAQQPNAPATVAERVASLQNQVFDELFASAQTAPDEEAIRLLREALTINPGAVNARVTLANKLIGQHSVDEARQVLDPIVNTADAEMPEVQQALAEIEVARNQFQEAITRYDRLARRDPRYTARLNDLKEQWNEQNMPPQYQRAYESRSIDRSDLAVLMYWKLTSVRFAQNLGTPPIAIDIEDTAGREELVRAIALGIYDVDPITRRVSPARPVSAATLGRLAARLLINRGADCARGIPMDRVLDACKISDPTTTTPPDVPVTGKQAAALLDELERVLPH